MVKAAASRTTYPSSTLEATRHGGARGSPSPASRPSHLSGRGVRWPDPRRSPTSDGTDHATTASRRSPRTCRCSATCGSCRRSASSCPATKPGMALGSPGSPPAGFVPGPARRQAPAPLPPATRLLPLCAGRWCTRPADIGSRAVYCVQGRHMEWKLECPLQSAQGLE